MLNSKLNISLLCAVSVLALQSSASYADSSQEERPGASVSAKFLQSEYVQKATGKAKSVVRDAVKNRGEGILDKQAEKIGLIAQNKFRELLLKDKSVRIVNANGEEVGLHIEKANSDVLRGLVRQFSGLDLDQSVPGVPAPIAKLVFNQVENYLLSEVSEYFGETVQQLTYNLAVQALGKAWNVADDKVSQYLLQTPKAKIAKPVTVNMNGLNEIQQSALQSLVNHYRSKIKMTVNGMIEDAVRSAVAAVAAKAYESVVEAAETGLRAAVLTPAVYEMPMLAPLAYFSDALKPQKGSKFNQFVRWALGSADSEKKLTNVAVGKAQDLVNKKAPSWLKVTEVDLNNVFGKHGTRDVEEGFTEIYQTEAPKSVSQLLSAFATGAQETVKKVAQAASDFSDLMGPEGISQEEFAEKYGNEDPTNPLPAIVNTGKSVFSKAKSFFGW